MARFVGIATETLYLRPCAPAELLALREGEEQFAAESLLKPSAGLRAMLVSDDVSPDWIEWLRKAVEADPWRFGFIVVERLTGVALGMASFKGPPDADGVVEIAYGIATDYRGRGYATQAAGGLVDFASNDERVRRIRAHTLPERNASASVLTKNGFEMLGTVEDPEDGLVWRWERDPEERIR